jgi:PKD repeat protein
MKITGNTILLAIIVGLVLLVGIVSADSDYCIPTSGVNVSVNTQGTWENITITSDDCMVWVDDGFGNITGTPCDNTPPESISNIKSKIECDTIEWSWDNPTTSDFNHTMVYWNDTFMYNVSNATHTVDWTGLVGSTAYTISTHTVDIAGNVNTTWVNKTESTTACVVVPVANFTADNVTICEYESVQFTDASTNTPTNWDWYPWGNETKASDLADPLVQYDVAGLFDVRLYVSNGAGNNWSNQTDYINVTDCTPPDHIEKLAETDNCYGINWTWIDPTNPPTTDLDHVEIWQNGVYLHDVAAGVEMDNWTALSNATWYNISTRTVDTSGNIDIDWVNKSAITDICVSPPAANFTANETEICLGDAIQFNDTSIPTPIIWLYAFGDGHTSPLQNPIYTYTIAGLFDVSLKIGTADGSHNETTKVDYINVTDCSLPATASFTSNVTCGIVPFNVGFTDTSTGGNITNWSWMFGDGNSSFVQHPNNTYSSVGMYTINFSVTNSIGTSWSNITNYITARFPGDTCAGGTGEVYDTDKYKSDWFTGWWG